MRQCQERRMDGGDFAMLSHGVFISKRLFKGRICCLSNAGDFARGMG